MYNCIHRSGPDVYAKWEQQRILTDVEISDIGYIDETLLSGQRLSGSTDEGRSYHRSIFVLATQVKLLFAQLKLAFARISNLKRFLCMQRHREYFSFGV